MDVPFLVRHGFAVGWSALAVSSTVYGIALGRWFATRRSRRAAKFGLDLLSKANTSDLRVTGEVVVLEGTIDCSLLQRSWHDVADGPSAGGEAATSSASKVIFVRTGGERSGGAGAGAGAGIELVGEIDILTSTCESYGQLRKGGWKHREIFGGDRVRLSGMLQLEEDSEQASPVDYRTSDRRFRFVPRRETGRIQIGSMEKNRGRLFLVPKIVLIFASTILFAFILGCVGRLAGGRAWERALMRGDLDSARDVMSWGSIGAATPFHRSWSLSAIDVAFSLDVKYPDPEFAEAAIQWEQYRSGGACLKSVHAIDLKRNDVTTIRAAAQCREPGARLVAAQAYLRRGEAEQASDAIDVYRKQVAARTDIDELRLSATAYLLAGRIASAATVLRELAPRAHAFYGKDNGDHAQHWYECGALELDARAGVKDARAKLEALTFEPDATKSEPYKVISRTARGFCAVFLADLLEGDERRALIQKIHGDRRFMELPELQSLEIEATPTTDLPSEGRGHLFFNSTAVLTPSILQIGVDAIKWRALEAMMALKDPTPKERQARIRLAADSIEAMAVLGGQDEAFAWHESLLADTQALKGTDLDPLGVNVARAQTMSVLLAVRFGRARPQVPHDLVDDRFAKELDGIVAVAERGDVSLLGWQKEGLFANGPIVDGNPYYNGLRLGVAGSGEELASWLLPRLDTVTLSVAMLTSRQLTTGLDNMREWLRHSHESSVPESLFENAARASARARIAWILELAPMAREQTDIADRLRKGMRRRDTGMAIHMLRLMGN